MAFDKTKMAMATTSLVSGDIAVSWTYKKTTDTMATMLGSAYFDEFNSQLHIDDIIYAVASDQKDFLRVVTITPNVTTVKVQPDVEDSQWERFVGPPNYLAPINDADSVQLTDAGIWIKNSANTNGTKGFQLVETLTGMVPGFEHAKVEFNGLTQGTEKTFIDYQGASNDINFYSQNWLYENSTGTITVDQRKINIGATGGSGLYFNQVQAKNNLGSYVNYYRDRCIIADNTATSEDGIHVFDVMYNGSETEFLRLDGGVAQVKASADFVALGSITSDSSGVDGSLSILDSSDVVRVKLDTNGASYLSGGHFGIGATPGTDVFLVREDVAAAPIVARLSNQGAGGSVDFIFHTAIDEVKLRATGWDGLQVLNGATTLGFLSGQGLFWNSYLNATIEYHGKKQVCVLQNDYAPSIGDTTISALLEFQLAASGKPAAWIEAGQQNDYTSDSNMDAFLAFYTQKDGASFLTEWMRLSSEGNFMLYNTTVPTGATNIFVMGNGTLGSALADTIQMTSADLSAGNTTLAVRTEGTSSGTGTGDNTSDGWIAVSWNGTTHYLLTKSTQPV